MRHLHGRRNLIARHARDLAEDKHGALALGQLSERNFEVGVEARRRELFGVRGRLWKYVGWCFGMSLTPTDLVEACETYAAKEPGA